MLSGLKVFAVILPVFLVIDLVWLGILMKDFYSHELGELARRQGTSLAPRWWAASLVYLLIPAGLVLFVRPLFDSNTTTLQAIGWGALYGVVVYGVYDLTNLAVIEKWTIKMTLFDIAWGAVLCGTVSAVMRFANQWLSR